MVETIGGRKYFKIYQKNQQVKCSECVFCSEDDTPFRRGILPGQRQYNCVLKEMPIGTWEQCKKKSCPSGKVPL